MRWPTVKNTVVKSSIAFHNVHFVAEYNRDLFMKDNRGQLLCPGHIARKVFQTKT